MVAPWLNVYRWLIAIGALQEAPQFVERLKLIVLVWPPLLLATFA